jgi:hypothetical protein
MVRLLLLLLNLLTTDRPRQRMVAGSRAGTGYGGDGPPPGARRGQPPPQPVPAPWLSETGREQARHDWPPAGGAVRDWAGPPRPARFPGGRRPRHPLLPWLKWTAAALVVGVIFRRVIASVVVAALSAVLHFTGFDVHLPHIKFAWPWQTISAGTTTNVDLGPWVLQKIEGISRPALGQANFTFTFTHKVAKNIGPWPCWYASTFYAVAHASATVNLNPGPAWWQPSAGHYQLQVLSRPAAGAPGRLAVTMVLPRPQLPATVHEVTIDNVPSKPIDTQHSWTYPGFGCGVVLKPQFPESVLYAEAQQIAFYRSRHAPMVTGPLVRAAEAEATLTIRDNFIQPTVNAFGYTLAQFTLRWA